MLAAFASKGLEILTVSSGALVTVLICGLLIFWIINEWRTPRAPRPPERDLTESHNDTDDAASDQSAND